MESNARRGKSYYSRLSRKKRKDEKWARDGCASASDYDKDMEDLKKEFEALDRMRKYFAFLEAMLTEMQVSHSESSDPLSIVDRMKGLLCDMGKVAMSGFPVADSSDLYPRCCEFMGKFSQLDDMVNRIERHFSRQTVRNLTKLLEDCQKTMLGIQVGLKEFQYIEAMERETIEIMSKTEELFLINESLDKENRKLLDIYKETSLIREELLRKRRYSW